MRRRLTSFAFLATIACTFLMGVQAWCSARERDAAETRAALAEAIASDMAKGWRLCEDELDRREALRR